MKVLITGGAGFLGSNLAKALSQKHDVTILDDFSREGSRQNAKWLGLPTIEHNVMQTIPDGEWDVIFHLAGQVTVTESVECPWTDAMVNVIGTINVLELARRCHAAVIYASTNKVYTDERFEPRSPYGCSKAAADCYVRDYAHTYGLRTVVLRMSCVYGPRQWGIEGQGWLSWFVKKALRNEPIKIYGDGRQVRDVLYVDDWVRLAEKVMTKLLEKPRKTIQVENKRDPSGQAFDVGGGKDRVVDLLGAIGMLSARLGKTIRIKWEHPRAGDQLIYVSNIARTQTMFDWRPVITIPMGFERLIEWERSIL